MAIESLDRALPADPDELEMRRPQQAGLESLALLPVPGLIPDNPHLSSLLENSAATIKALELAVFATVVALGITALVVFRHILRRAEERMRKLKKMNEDLALRVQRRTRQLLQTSGRLGREVAERRLAQETLAKLANAVEQAADSIFITDRNGVIEFVNPAFERLTGYSKEEVVGRKGNILRSGQLAEEFYATLWKTILAGRPFRGEFVNRRKDGTLFYEEKTITPVLNEHGQITHFVSVGRDIGERKRAEETIRRLAYQDPLTGLANRTLFEDRLRVALAQGRRKKQMVGLIFMDLDGFKRVNDSATHAVGDRLLRAAARRLAGLVREGDTVARLGGDEFALLLPGMDGLGDVTAVAERILATFREPWRVGALEFHVTASLGIAIFPDHGGDAQTILRNADIAMYQAKDGGRGAYLVYDPAMSERITRRVELEREVTRAINRDELVMYYQPVFTIDGREIVGAEALARWQHPDHGLIPPSEFIPFAEESGLILPLNDRLVRRACADIRDWQRAGLDPVPISINIPTALFDDAAGAERLVRILNEMAVEPDRILLEVTESTLMRDLDNAAAILACLREIGIGAVIDDFGTGHSTLSYLSRLPIDGIKIDRTFVRNLTADGRNAAIVGSLIELAHQLGLTVTAEGVEREEERAALAAMGCDRFQGFLYSRPVPKEEFVALLRAAARRGRRAASVSGG